MNIKGEDQQFIIYLKDKSKMIGIKNLTKRIKLSTFKNTKRFYDDKVVEYFENPPNVGSFKRKRKDVGTGKPNGINPTRHCRINCLRRPAQIPSSGR